MCKEYFNELGKAFIQVGIILSEIGYKIYYYTEYMAKTTDIYWNINDKQMLNITIYIQFLEIDNKNIKTIPQEIKKAMGNLATKQM